MIATLPLTFEVLGEDFQEVSKYFKLAYLLASFQLWHCTLHVLPPVSLSQSVRTLVMQSLSIAY